VAEKKIDVHYDFKGNEIRNAILIGGAGNEVKKTTSGNFNSRSAYNHFA